MNARVAGMADEEGGPGGLGGRAGLARPGSGAAAAVTDLFREHHLELVRLALVMVGDLATAEDVVQDVFERLHRGWHGLRQTVRDATGGQNGTAGQLDQDCNVLSLAPTGGVHVLVACFAVGRVDGDRFTPLPGFPSPSSSGISGQQAVAW